ncbi:MAG TPA: response regulator, partial [Nannocystis exedens]|nr:response regulator [Nannocystis exedens]
NAELELARDEALAANHAKSAFLATMSHELRTPLNAIIGYSELIGEEYEHLPLTADIERILSASLHLLELINGVLDLSKIEAGRMDLFYESIPVNTLIRGVADAVRPTIERNKSHLVLNLGRGLGTIESDLTKVRQILLNLASNAAKFTSKGTVEIVAASSRNAEGENGLELSVRDTGIGIPKENLQTIFTPFVQADPSTTRLFGGTGLGLSITRRFVKMLGGHMKVTSKVGVGSCFTVWLPRRPPGSATSEHETSSAWQLAQFEGNTTNEPSDVSSDMSPSMSSSMSMSVGPMDGAHVLVIDESPEVHQYLRRLLVKEGFRVSVATSGAEGLALAHRDRPDLITIDVVKRSADSWEVLCELNNDHELARVPVHAISFGAAGPDKPPSGLRVADFFSIPVEPELLSELLDRYLGDSKVAEERPRVLIVDDDARIRAGLHAALDRKRFRITEAHGGAEAIVALRAAHTPDLIILDLMMPIIDGFAVLDEITENPKLQGLPVLISLPRVLTIAELYILSERARTHIRRGR